VKVKGFNKRRFLSAPAVVAAIALLASGQAYAQDALGGSRPSTVLPTDTAPIPLSNERQALGESLKLRLWQKLPARFYFSGTVESSFRIETNVFQFPSRSSLLRKFAPEGLENLSPEGAQAVQGLLDRAYAEDVVFRVTPNVTAGWALTKYTRVYGNYFCLRDKLFKNNLLNTTINQFALGIEHRRPIPKTPAQIEVQFQARELFQQGADPVFDYIPSLTLSTPLTKRGDWYAYFNALLQLRSTKFMYLPNRNITPFYTWGVGHSRGKWAFSANATLLNSFQKGFSQSSLGFNSGSWICDFEIARQVIDRLPGFQAFVRCEPVFNFGGRNTPGLSGADVRVFFGLRMSAYKPDFVSTMEMLKQHYQPPKEKKPKGKEPPAPETKPADGEKKKQKTDPGAPIGMGDDSDDLSIITLDGELLEDGQYPKFKISNDGGSIIDSSTFSPTTPTLLDAANWSRPLLNPLELEAPEELEAKAETLESPNSLEAIESTPEATPTAAPMHGFLRQEKQDVRKRLSTISSISNF